MKEINLNDLKREIPFMWRVQSFSKQKAQATCVAYIDSRDAQDLLDEVAGAENWMCDYKEIKNVVYCGVAIKLNDEWVWKWDCGTQSNEDAEKGEASDSFKRACVKWGIGRFLYSLPIQYVDANEAKSGSNYPHVVDENKKKVYDLTEFINKRLGKNKKVDQVGLCTEEQINIARSVLDDNFTEKERTDYLKVIAKKNKNEAESLIARVAIEKCKRLQAKLVPV